MINLVGFIILDRNSPVITTKVYFEVEENIDGSYTLKFIISGQLYILRTIHHAYGTIDYLLEVVIILVVILTLYP